MKMNQQKLDSAEAMLHKFLSNHQINHYRWQRYYSGDQNEPVSKLEIYRGMFEQRPYLEYYIDWDEAPSLTEAMTPMFANILAKLGIPGDVDIPGVLPAIKKVIFNYPATIVLWADGTKTVVKAQGWDIYNRETGLAMCIAKKAMGNKGNFNNVFRQWIPGVKEAGK